MSDDGNSKQDVIRVLRVIEYTGPRNLVEAQVERSLTGTKRLNNGVTIKAATVGAYPEILEAAAEVDQFPAGTYCPEYRPFGHLEPLKPHKSVWLCDDCNYVTTKGLEELYKHRAQHHGPDPTCSNCGHKYPAGTAHNCEITTGIDFGLGPDGFFPGLGPRAWAERDGPCPYCKTNNCIHWTGQGWTNPVQPVPKS